jgi:predicted metal-dependent hydrolase
MVYRCAEVGVNATYNGCMQQFPYTLRRSPRARLMRLAVYPDGAVVVVAPSRFGKPAIDRFIQKYAPWVERKIEESKGRTILRIARRDIPMLKKRAETFVRDRCAHFAKVYGTTFGTITVRSQKTRWGSCSHKGNLSFNYKIALLPPHLAEYIIVHEICHLRELNHSKRFWKLVAQLIPDYKSCRREIRAIATVYL